MTPDYLAAIRARAEAATEGPWAWASHTTADGDEWAVFDPADHALASNRDGWAPDAEFIAHARSDVPALLAEVDRLRAHVERNGIQWCACSRADRMNERRMPRCPYHGDGMAVQRNLAEQERDEARDERDVLAAKIERVEALATECEGQHGQCWNSIFGQRIRAALADPEGEA